MVTWLALTDQGLFLLLASFIHSLISPSHFLLLLLSPSSVSSLPFLFISANIYWVPTVLFTSNTNEGKKNLLKGVLRAHGKGWRGEKLTFIKLLNMFSALHCHSIWPSQQGKVCNTPFIENKTKLGDQKYPAQWVGKPWFQLRFLLDSEAQEPSSASQDPGLYRPFSYMNTSLWNAMQKAVICTCGQDAINLLCEVREDLRGWCLVSEY